MESAISIFSLIVSAITAAWTFVDRRRAKFNIESSYWTELFSWYSETHIILKTLQTANLKPQDKDMLLSHLSALIDKGRFYFPNLDKQDGFGKEKPVAFRGYRHLALEFLVASYQLHGHPSTKEQASLAQKLDRQFTSIMYEVLQPKKRFASLLKMTNHFYPVDKSIEDMFEDQDQDLVDAIWRINAG